MAELTHQNERGEARMVDVGDKDVTRRVAKASAMLKMPPDVIACIVEGRLPKGDAVTTARIAGIMAAKKTSDLIPLCHPLPLDTVTIDFEFAQQAVIIRSMASTHAKTGVEMEALTAVSIAALTLYDMVKSMGHAIVIERIQLEEKSGGRSGRFIRE